MKRVSILALLLLPIAVFAQTAAPASVASAGASKVGVINIRTAITTTSEGKQAVAELQSRFASQQGDIAAIQKKIVDADKGYQDATVKKDAAAVAEFQQEDQLYRQQAKNRQDELTAAANAANTVTVDRIGRKLMEVLQKYAATNGYVLILDNSSNGTPVVYSALQVDITNEVVNAYDQAYPVKAAPEPKKPEVPKKN